MPPLLNDFDWNAHVKRISVKRADTLWLWFENNLDWDTIPMNYTFDVLIICNIASIRFLLLLAWLVSSMVNFNES